MEPVCQPLDGGQSQTEAVDADVASEVCQPLDGGQSQTPSLSTTLTRHVGLLDGRGYSDYQFEFDLELPLAGQGVTGWIVRAKDSSNYLLFQLQSADSTCNVPEWKTRPNTLRPHVCHDGQLLIAEPVTLPKEVRRGETHHIVVECRGSQVTVLLDGEKVATQEDAGLRTGTVGFRAADATERGLFRNIVLQRLD
jgi:hypothetical protein